MVIIAENAILWASMGEIDIVAEQIQLLDVAIARLSRCLWVNDE